MWMKPIFLLLIIIILFVVSASQVVNNRQKKVLKQTPNEIPSAISQALTYLVGVAGGIYISLVMLASFLKIALPESIQIFGVSLDPLAVIAFALAIIQPWVIKAYNSISNK